jgi:hypothetical protein
VAIFAVGQASTARLKILRNRSSPQRDAGQTRMMRQFLMQAITNERADGDVDLSLTHQLAVVHHAGDQTDEHRSHRRDRRRADHHQGNNNRRSETSSRSHDRFSTPSTRTGLGVGKGIAAVWDAVPVQRCTVLSAPHGPSACARREHYTDLIYAATPEEIEIHRKALIASGGCVIAPSPTAWRKPASASRLHPTAAEPMAKRENNERDRAPALDQNQTVPPSADTAAMWFCALLASGQINIRKVDGWQTLATNPIDQQIDLVA